MTVKTCKSLTRPENGRVTPEICTREPKHRQKCTFGCNAGYTGYKRTPFSITCYDGHWSASTGFYCSGKRKKNSTWLFSDRAISQFTNTPMYVLDELLRVLWLRGRLQVFFSIQKKTLLFSREQVVPNTRNVRKRPISPTLQLKVKWTKI